VRGLRETLRRSLPDRFTLVGLGNPASGDDAFGYYVARRLAPLRAPGFRAVPAGVWLERLPPSDDPVVLVDAVVGGFEPGTVAVVRDPEPEWWVDGHRVGLARLNVRLLIGFAPVRVGLGERMSEEARKAARMVIRVVRDVVLERVEGPPDAGLRGGPSLPGGRRTGP
jgi:hydrogenase maturation protease